MTSVIDVTSMFADDVGLIIEENVNEVNRCSREKKLRLNNAKCEVSCSARATRGEASTPLDDLRGSRFLKFNPTPVYLSVTYDKVLSFWFYVEKIARKASRLLLALSSREWAGMRSSYIRYTSP